MNKITDKLKHAYILSKVNPPETTNMQSELQDLIAVDILDIRREYAQDCLKEIYELIK